jgi:hypothetical protein
MKRLLKILSLILFFVATVALWASTPRWISRVANWVAQVDPIKCKGGVSEEQCRQLISTFGATGDIFGAASSLFSALALFAVALTLWIEAKSRRDLKKPLLVPSINEETIVIDDPKDDGGFGVRLAMVVGISNQTVDAALDVLVKSHLFDGRDKISLPEIYIDVPVVVGATVSGDCFARISGPEMERMLSALTRDDGKVDLTIVVEYRSLEKAKWMTAVTYELSCHQSMDKKRLNAVRGDRTDIDELWAGGAAVSPVVRVKRGSWQHRGLS